MIRAATMGSGRRSVSTPVDDKRVREKALFRTINRCVLSSIAVGGFFAVVAAMGGMKAQGQTLDPTGSALGVMAMFLGVSLVLIVVLLIRFALRERRHSTNSLASSLDALEPSSA